MHGSEIEWRLLSTCFVAQCQTFLGMLDGSFRVSRSRINGREQVLGTQMIQQIANLQPMEASGVGGVNHPLGFIRRAITFFEQIPCQIVQLDCKPTMRCRQFKWRR